MKVQLRQEHHGGGRPNQPAKGRDYGDRRPPPRSFRNTIDKSDKKWKRVHRPQKARYSRPPPKEEEKVEEVKPKKDKKKDKKKKKGEKKEIRKPQTKEQKEERKQRRIERRRLIRARNAAAKESAKHIKQDDKRQSERNEWFKIENFPNCFLEISVDDKKVGTIEIELF